MQLVSAGDWLPVSGVGATTDQLRADFMGEIDLGCATAEKSFLGAGLLDLPALASM